MGYLSEAVVNYVTLLAGLPEASTPSGSSLPCRAGGGFDIGGISKSPAIFDIEKLTYFNAHYLREMSPRPSMRPPCPTSARRCRIPPSPRRRSPGCSRPGASVSPTSQRSWTFDALPDYDAGLFTNKKSKTNPEVSRRMLEAVLPALEGWPTGPWTGFMTL